MACGFKHWEDELPAATFDSAVGEWVVSGEETSKGPSAVARLEELELALYESERAGASEEELCERRAVIDRLKSPPGQNSTATLSSTDRAVESDQNEVCSGLSIPRHTWNFFRADDITEPPALLRVATFNLWYADDFFEERTAAMLAILRDEEADVICLQEVTPDFLQRLLAQQWIRDQYTASHSRPDSLGVMKYATVMLSKLKVLRFSSHDLPSFMDRRLIVGELSLQNHGVSHRVVVATIHLESESQTASRQQQMECMAAWLRQKDGSYIIAGDFNFDTVAEENKALEVYNWQDVWPELKPNQDGYTRDTAVNSLLRAQYPDGLQARYDRIIVHNHDAGGYVVQPITIRRLGLATVSSELPHVHPSDHFGLCSSFYIMSHEESKRRTRQSKCCIQ